MDSPKNVAGLRYSRWRFIARLRDQIRCQHPDLHAQLTDLGMGKMWWCDDCGASWH